MNFATVNSRLPRIGRTAVCVGFLLVGSLGVAQAATPSDEVPSLVVRYGDLDLSTAAGARALSRRLSTAAHQVCPFEDSKAPAQMAYNNTCRAEAIARAVHDINSPQLAALEAGRARRG
jgi:UrcA family protein